MEKQPEKSESEDKVIVPAPQHLPESKAMDAKTFLALSEMPPEFEWFGNINNDKTRRAYQIDISEFMAFCGIKNPDQLRIVTRPHVIAWRKSLEARNCQGSTIRRKLAALSSLFEHLCECNAVVHNPVKGVKRPKANNNEGKTPALSDLQALALMNAPDPDTLKGKRDQAIIATLLYHAIRREELCNLKVRDIQQRQGVVHITIHGKGEKIRYIPIGLKAQRLISIYLGEAGHGKELDSPLFRPVKNNVTKILDKPLHPDSVYTMVNRYAAKVGIKYDVHGFCVHSTRATAITSALEHGADIAKVQEWAGHANISTTRLYDRLSSSPEDRPTFRLNY